MLIAYGFMLASLAINHSGYKHHFVCIGWGTAFIIALFASIAEVTMGRGICPVSGGASNETIPLCFISLAMLVAILVIFIIAPNRRACEIHNKK